MARVSCGAGLRCFVSISFLILIGLTSRSARAEFGDLLQTYVRPAGQTNLNSPFGLVGGEVFVAGADNNGRPYVNFYAAETGAFLRTLTVTSPGITHVLAEATTDGQRFAVRMFDSQSSDVRIVDPVSGATLRTFSDPAPGQFDRNFGAQIALAGNDILIADRNAQGNHGTVHVFDIASGAHRFTFEDPTTLDIDFGIQIGATPDRFLITAPGHPDDQFRAPGAVYAFDRATGALVGTAIGRPQIEINEVFGTKLAVDGHRFLVGGESVDYVQLYDARNMTLLHQFDSPEGPYGETVAFVSGDIVIGGKGPAPEDATGIVELFDGNSKVRIDTITAPYSGPENVFARAIEPAGNNLLVFDAARLSLELYEGRSLPSLASLTIPTSRLSAMTFRRANPPSQISGAIFQTRILDDGVEFEVSVADPNGAPYAADAYVGLDAVVFGATELGDYDKLSLRMTNNDNSVWDVALYARADDGSEYRGDFTKLSLLGSALVELNLDVLPGQVSIDDLAEIGFIIRGQLDGVPPNPSNSDIAKILVRPVPTATPIPEPSAMQICVATISTLFLLRRYRNTPACRIC
jgi:hypothetical protein